MAGHSSSTPFKGTKDGYNSKRVTFDMQDSLDEKIGKPTSMMNIFTAQDNNQNKQLKPKICQGRGREKSRNNYPDHNNYQNRYISNSRDRRTSFRGRGQDRQNKGRKTMLC